MYENSCKGTGVCYNMFPWFPLEQQQKHVDEIIEIISIIIFNIFSS